METSHILELSVDYNHQIPYCNLIYIFINDTNFKSYNQKVWGLNPALGSLVAVCNSSPGRPVPCEGNLVATAVWWWTSVAPAGNKSRLTLQASHVKYEYLPTYLKSPFVIVLKESICHSVERVHLSYSRKSSFVI